MLILKKLLGVVVLTAIAPFICLAVVFLGCSDAFAYQVSSLNGNADHPDSALQFVDSVMTTLGLS